MSARSSDVPSQHIFEHRTSRDSNLHLSGFEPPFRATSWRGEFTASHSGELAIFANEAVLPFKTADRYNLRYFYTHPKYGNEGQARIPLERASTLEPILE